MTNPHGVRYCKRAYFNYGERLLTILSNLQTRGRVQMFLEEPQLPEPAQGSESPMSINA